MCNPGAGQAQRLEGRRGGPVWLAVGKGLKRDPGARKEGGTARALQTKGEAGVALLCTVPGAKKNPDKTEGKAPTKGRRGKHALIKTQGSSRKEELATGTK